MFDNDEKIKQGTTYIIILNYNGWPDTVACLASVAKLRDAAYKIVVVDNGSVDASVAKLNEWVGNHPNVPITLLTSAKNLGYSGGNNIGVKYALAQDDCSYLWILNNDTEVDPYALKYMLERCDEGYDGVGSTIMDFSRRTKVQLVGGRINWTNFSLESVGSGCDINALRADMEICTLSGPSFLLRRAVVDKIGVFDDTFFLYCEELDYAFRAEQAGFAFSYAVKALVYHKESASTGKKSTSFRDYHLYRSWLLFVGRHCKERLPKLRALCRKLMRQRLRHLHFKRAWALHKALSETEHT